MVCLCNAIPHDSDDAVLPQGLDGSERARPRIRAHFSREKHRHGMLLHGIVRQCSCVNNSSSQQDTRGATTTCIRYITS